MRSFLSAKVTAWLRFSEGLSFLTDEIPFSFGALVFFSCEVYSAFSVTEQIFDSSRRESWHAGRGGAGSRKSVSKV